MPELPEVETVARGLNASLKNVMVRRMHVLSESSIGFPNPSKFKNQIETQKFIEVKRRGKFLKYVLSGGLIMLQHLRMSGQMILCQPDLEYSPFLRAYFELDNGKELRFNDQRRFGRLWLFTKSAAREFLERKKLGPEPLSDEWTAERFYQGLRQRRARIKPLLMNQSFVAGLGNIYVDESLFKARIHPLRVSDTLSKEEVGNLYRAIRNIVTRAIDERGTSMSSYRDSMGRPGTYLKLLNVYKKKGLECPRCHNPIVYSKVGQRGTHYCANCQKLL